MKAIREANIRPPESTSWDCHGTGTSLGDPIEVGSIRRIQVKEPRAQPLSISTNKTSTGHLEGGAAMTTLIKAVLQVQLSRVYGVIHLRQLNPHLEQEAFDANFMTEMLPFAFRQANSHVSSFGFGGTNGHMIFWGRNVTDAPDVHKLLAKRLLRQSPPEVRLLGRTADEWETDGPEQECTPGSKWYIEIHADDPMDAPQRWHARPPPEEDAEESYYMVTGNFNDWLEDRMEMGELPGVHSVMVDIPESGVLQFRFIGEEVVLAPAVDMCTKMNAPILAEPGLTNSWCVKGEPGAQVEIELFARERKSLLWLKK